MVRGLALVFGSILAGLFMDALKHWGGMDEWRYRYYAVWTLACQVPAIGCMLLLYRQWQARGGEEGYTAPGTESEQYSFQRCL